MNSCNYNHNINIEEKVICLGKTNAHLKWNLIISISIIGYDKTVGILCRHGAEVQYLQDRQEISSSLKSL